METEQRFHRLIDWARIRPEWNKQASNATPLSTCEADSAYEAVPVVLEYEVRVFYRSDVEAGAISGRERCRNHPTRSPQVVLRRGATVSLARHEHAFYRNRAIRLVDLGRIVAVGHCRSLPISARNWFQCISFHSAHRATGSSGLKPILKPTGCQDMQPRANRRAVLDLRADDRRPPATPKFESPLPHDFGPM